VGRFINVQTNFSAGELDPLLRARVDLDVYRNALTTAANVVCQPQGGIKRRPGLSYIHSFGSDPSSGVRMVPFEFSTSDSYMLVFTNNAMTIFKNKALITNINSSGSNFLNTSSVGLTGARLDTICWTQSADTLIVCHEDINPVKIVRGGSDSSWTASALAFTSIPKFAYSISTTSPVSTITPSAISGNVTITCSHAHFTTDHLNQYINADPQGRARIIEVVSTSVVKVVVEYPFYDTAAIPSSSWEIESGYEDVWSNTRGWQRSVTFHEGRMYFGGSKSRPSTVWGSRSGLFFDFKPDSDSLDDDAIEATLDTNTFNAITDINSGRDLQVFTTGGEFYVPQEGMQPITPSNFFIRSATKNGSKEGIRTTGIESGTLFIQRAGKSLNELRFTDVELSYGIDKISLLSGHLLKTPTNMALRKAVATDENDLLLVTNSDDGSIACYSLLRKNNVIAPSSWTTDGEFVDVAVDVDTIYTVVKRTVNSSTVYYLEYFNDEIQLDSALNGTGTSSTTVAHLVAKSVDMVLDGQVQAAQTVPGGGSITFARAAASTFQIGLNFTTEIKTMPVEISTNAGSRLGFKKRIVEVNAMVKDCQHLLVNGVEVPFRNLGDTLLDEAVPSFTGTKTIDCILGYTTDGQITVTQTLPLPMVLLGMEYRVATSIGS
jgi:hypothetical protein